MAVERMYSNPVVTGFFPDPSIVRVGEDYYMVNSTFQYFPAIVISHSRDLVHWEIIGHAITENEYLDLSEILDSHGIWAPDISCHKGIFYIFATLRQNTPGENESWPLRRQLMMKSDRPEGPYSKPVLLDVDSIDPSHFIDDDGTHYFAISPGVRIVKLNEDCTEIVEGPVTLWPGTGRKAPEGPHILKKDGYYYAILAEGGTEFGHCITVGRSKNLYGPYEDCPYNPVLVQTDPEAYIQRAGHGKLVQTPKGEWWMTYLCARTNDGPFCTLGRETALEPVQWTEDGWFTVNSGKGPSKNQTAPSLPEVKYEEKYFDDFDSETLALNWEFVRNPDSASWSLKERPGYFRIWTGDHDLNRIQAKNTLLRREKDHRYTATVKLEFHPRQTGEQAGLTCYYGISNHAKLFLTYEEGLKIRLVENRNKAITCLGEISGITQNIAYLREVVNRQERDFYYSPDQINWVFVGRIADARFLSDEGVLEGKHHTGTLVGIYANNGGNGTRIAADFDWFRYEAAEDSKRRIVIVGDSTASSYEAHAAPRAGWGQTFRQFFTEEVEVKNHASSGRSTKSFIEEGRMEAALNELRANDFLLIQFGHNDEKKEDPTRYTEPYTTYKENLGRFVQGARERGAYPVLLTSIERRDFDPAGKIQSSHGEYPKAMLELSRELNVPCIDITSKSQELFNRLGEEKTKDLFLWLEPGENSNYPEGVKDNTHFKETGAIEIGKLVIEGLEEMGHPLVKFFKKHI